MALYRLAALFPPGRRARSWPLVAAGCGLLALASAGFYAGNPAEPAVADLAALDVAPHARLARPIQLQARAAGATTSPIPLAATAAPPPELPGSRTTAHRISKPVTPLPAKPLQPSVPAFASITVQGQPGSLASISDIDGNFTSIGLIGPDGQLTRALTIAAGSYTLSLDHRDYVTASAPVELRPGDTALAQPTQSPRPGSLHITSRPEGADVVVDGDLLGQTPLWLSDRPSGQPLNVELRLSGHATAHRQVSLAPREIRSLDFGALEPVRPAPLRPALAPRSIREIVEAEVSVAVSEIQKSVPVADPPREDARPQASPAYAGPHPRQSWTVPGLGLELLWVGPGHFLMGSPAADHGRNLGEPIQTSVAVRSGFWIGRFEVSQADFEYIMGTRPSAFPKSGHFAPVEQVSWHDAMEFCQRLTEAERKAGRLPKGYVYSLPTETQWEYACRAGSDTARPDAIEYMAWFSANSRRRTHRPDELLPVLSPSGAADSGPARFIPERKPVRPNAWGLVATFGNVAEWCLDDLNAVRATAQQDAGTDTGPRVARGGSWKSPASELRTAHRENLPAETRRSDIGFRVALTPIP